MTHFRADAAARTSSRQVSTPPMKRAWIVVIHSSRSVRAVVVGQADQISDRVAHTTNPTTNQGRRCSWTGGRMTNHRMTETIPPPIVTAAATGVPNACTQAVPDSAMKSTKMHQPRSSRCRVVSRTGGAGGVAAGCFEWTAIG